MTIKIQRMCEWAGYRLEQRKTNSCLLPSRGGDAAYLVTVGVARRADWCSGAVADKKT